MTVSLPLGIWIRNSVPVVFIFDTLAFDFVSHLGVKKFKNLTLFLEFIKFKLGKMFH